MLYEPGASAAQGRDAVEDAGGRIVTVNTAFCDGPPSNNGFYGDGILSAIGAIGARH